MNSELRNLLDQERRRVFEPGAFFAQRVVAHARAQKSADAGIWDIVPAATRPIFALGLTLLLAFLTLETFVPVEPTRNMVEASLEPEQSSFENVLYMDSETPASQELLEQMIVLEEGAQ